MSQWAQKEAEVSVQSAGSCPPGVSPSQVSRLAAEIALQPALEQKVLWKKAMLRPRSLGASSRAKDLVTLVPSSHVVLHGTPFPDRTAVS